MLHDWERLEDDDKEGALSARLDKLWRFSDSTALVVRQLVGEDLEIRRMAVAGALSEAIDMSYTVEEMPALHHLRTSLAELCHRLDAQVTRLGVLYAWTYDARAGEGQR